MSSRQKGLQEAKEQPASVSMFLVHEDKVSTHLGIVHMRDMRGLTEGRAVSLGWAGGPRDQEQDA